MCVAPDRLLTSGRGAPSPAVLLSSGRGAVISKSRLHEILGAKAAETSASSRMFMAMKCSAQIITTARSFSTMDRLTEVDIIVPKGERAHP